MQKDVRISRKIQRMGDLAPGARNRQGKAAQRGDFTIIIGCDFWRGNVTFGFDAVFYYVTNLSAAIDFYSGVLGFCLSSRDAVARFNVDGVLFELVPTSDRAKFGGTGNARVCLRVPNVVQALQELQAGGVPTSGPEAKENGILASFWDPDGNELCLWEYAN